MNRRVMCLGVALALVSVVFLTTSPPARALRWIQTSPADFLAGTRSGIEVTPTGELVLSRVPIGWSREGIVVDLGTNAPYDTDQARCPYVIHDGATYRMWYTGSDSNRFRILYATSPDGVTWTGQGIAINVLTAPGNFDSAMCPSVMKDGATYKMWFLGGRWTPTVWGQIYYATSADATTWTYSTTPALGLGAPGTWDDYSLWTPNVIKESSGRYDLFYTGDNGVNPGWNMTIGRATSATGVTFTRSGASPILVLGPTGSWDDREVEMPSVLEGTPWQLWYTGLHTTRAIGRATSADGGNWSKVPGNPEFTGGPPGAWDGAGVLTAQVFVDGTDTFLYYSGWDGVNQRIGRAHQSIGYAPSGWFESAVLDSGGVGTVWNSLSSNATVSAVSQIWLRTRSGNTPTPDPSWSAWTAPLPPPFQSIASPRARYLQVRVEMATGSPGASPFLGDFTVDYSLNTATAPTPYSPVGGVWVNTTGLQLVWNYSDVEGDAQGAFHVQVSNRSDFATVEAESGDVLSSQTSWRTPPLADGGWYWRVRTMDAYGIWSGYSAPAYVRIDTVPPATFDFESGVRDWVGGVPVMDASTRLVLTANDLGSGVATTMVAEVAGPPPAPYPGPFLPSGHGLVPMQYWSTDAAGNVEPRKGVLLLLDNAPSVAAASPANGTWTNASRLALGWTSSDPDTDPVGSYEVQLATDPSFAALAYTSGKVTSGATEHTFPGVADGTYWWRVRAADVYDVWSLFSAPRTVSVDTGLPTVARAFSATLGTVDGRTWVAPGTALTLTATDSGSGVADIFYSMDGGAATGYGGPIALTAHGTHEVTYWAVDVAGNIGPSGRADILVDRAPAASNRAPAAQAWVNRPPSLGWDFTDPDGDPSGGYEVQVSTDPSFAILTASSGAVASPASEWHTPALADGMYAWRVRVRDTLDVWSGWSSPTQFRLDATPPETSAIHDGAVIPEGVGAFSMAVGGAIALNATDAGSGVAGIEYAVDGGAWTSYASPVPFGTAGLHVLLFRATDVAGNSAPVKALAIVATSTSAVPQGELNWTPVIAALLALAIALLGVVVARRRKDPAARPSKRFAWAMMAAPATALEVVIGVYSLVTGELATPPWLGPGLLLVLAVAVVGFVSIGLGWRAFRMPSAETAEPPPPSE